MEKRKHEASERKLDAMPIIFRQPFVIKLCFTKARRFYIHREEIGTSKLTCKWKKEFNYEEFRKMAAKQGKIYGDDEICPHCGLPLSTDEIIAITDLKKGAKALCPNCRWDITTNTKYSSKNYEIGWG